MNVSIIQHSLAFPAHIQKDYIFHNYLKNHELQIQ